MWGQIAALAGKLLSGGAKGMEQGRESTNNANVSRDRTIADAIAEYERAQQGRAKIDIDQRTQDLDTRDQGYKQTLHAQSLKNWQPAQRPSRIPMVRGGFNTIPEESRKFAGDFEQQAMVRALQGQKYAPMPAQERFRPTPVKEPSLWEKIIGITGLGLQGAGAIKGLMNKNAGESD
jgi:hypothetical protein